MTICSRAILALGLLAISSRGQGSPQDQDLVETFATATARDPNLSSGVWNQGARAGLLGGSGIHGSFDATLGVDLGNQVYLWNVDNFTVPAYRTLSAQNEVITDGRFFFTDMVVPAGITVRFEGTHPVQIHVAGRVEIAGRIELDAPSMSSSYVFRAALSGTPVQGQPGGLGGPGGARGGRGADRCLNTGPIIAGGVIQTDGQPGESVRLPAGHAYAARTAGTGGPGSPMYPATGLNSSVQYTILSAFSGQIAVGGSGGGHWTAGAAGSVSPSPGIVAGPAGGTAAAFDNFPIPPGVSSLNHFLVGGSGGGGGGSHLFLAVSGNASDVWKAGAGGSGGGGALAIRAGGAIRVLGTGVVQSRGGAGTIFSDRVTAGVPAPGGGGSGGSLLLQAGEDLLVEGTLDTSGSTGSRTGNIQPVNLNANCFGGAGSSGTYRLEASGGQTIQPVSLVPALDPARHQGSLNDRDDRTVAVSLWRATGRNAPPDWKRYVLEVDVNGDGSIDSVFSDDPSTPNSIGLANNPLGPVTIRFQGALVPPSSSAPVAGSLGPWRATTNSPLGSLQTDQATGFRFQLGFNRRDFPNAVVRSLVVTIGGCGGPGFVQVASLPALALPMGLSRFAVEQTQGGGTALLVGGSNGTNFNFGTYLLNGPAWVQQFPIQNPSPRIDAALVLDRVRGTNVLFGGRNPAGTMLADTWTWLGGQWTLRQPATSPVARSGHRMVFDAVRGTCILFGGRDASGSPLGDMWAWDGSNWNQISTATSPPARHDHGMAFDPIRGRTLLFGGQGATGLRNDLWEWNGAAWSAINTPAGATPAPRALHAMGFDPFSESVLISGGLLASGCTGDVFSWNGSNWQQHVPCSNPQLPVRVGSQLLADGRRGLMLLLGGECGATSYSDVHSLELPVVARAISYGAGCAGSLGVPSLAVQAGSTPLLGSSFVVEISSIPGSPLNVPFGVFDLQRDTFAGLPIPADLTFAGLPGCQAWTGASWTYVLPTAGTQARVSWTVAIPASTGLLGKLLYLQAVILDNSNGRFASLTNALEARIGNR